MSLFETLRLPPLPSVYAHISGPSGCGKTTVGNYIAANTDRFQIKDVDVLWEASSANTKRDAVAIAKRFHEKLSKWITEYGKDKPTILIGLTCIIHAKTSTYYFVPIEAQHRFTIDIPFPMLMKQIALRDIQKICANPLDTLEGILTGGWAYSWNIEKQKMIKKAVDQYLVKEKYRKIFHNNIIDFFCETHRSKRIV